MKPHVENQTCPLCWKNKANQFHQDKRRKYFLCLECGLVFVPEEWFVSAEEEKARYDSHQNSSKDQGYLRFLSRIFVPMQNCLPPKSQGLDFGSGPCPVLSRMFEDFGHQMTIYDRFYARAPSVFAKKYDFITVSEVVEHLRNPQKELDRLWNLLKLGGVLGIMTQQVISQEAFSNWHYKNDFTHICFFSDQTFKWLADRWQADIEFFGSDVIIFHKTI